MQIFGIRTLFGISHSVSTGKHVQNNDEMSFKYNNYFKSSKAVENIFASKNISKHGKGCFGLFFFGYVCLYLVSIYDNVHIRRTCMNANAADVSKTIMDLLREKFIPCLFYKI